MIRGVRPARETTFNGIRRVFTLDLKDERWDSLFQFHAEVMPNLSIQDCARELLAHALSTAAGQDWTEGRRLAVRAIRHDVHTRVAQALRQIADEILGVDEAMGQADYVPHQSGLVAPPPEDLTR